LTEESLQVERTSHGHLHDLRRRVLRGGDPEARVTEPRDDEPTTWHFAGLLGERVVVSASFYLAPALFDAAMVAYQLRYMATDQDVQGRGYGATVLGFAETRLRDVGAEQLWAHARDSALGFYRSCGWTVVEDSAFLSVETQLPHHVIFKALG